MSSFISLNLHPNISKAIEACGYTTPTPIQAKSIPHILEGKDIVASAQTGTGKTAAFVLPALHRLSSKEKSKKTGILILTPTRELASQITTAATQYGKFLRFNIVNLVGGMPYHQQIRELSRGADIIVATPGRLLDHINSKRVDLSGIEMLILDEADRMLDMGFIEDVEYIAKLTPANRQTLLFSATVDKELTNVVRHLLKNPVRVDMSNEKMTVPQIEQLLYKANNPQHKVRLLKHFLNDKNIFKAIIFSATKINADKIADKLRDDGFSAAALHGDLRQNVRNRTIDQLRRGKIQFLVATDVAARGIDISDITHVINYDLPRFCEDYVHRIGRTGRAGKSGVAISFVLPTDTRNLQRIERFIGQRLKLISNLDVGQGEQGGEGEGTRTFEKPAFKREYQRDNDRSSFNNDRPFKKRSESGRDRGTSFRDRDNDRPFKKRSEGRGGFNSEENRNRSSSFRDRDNDRPFKKRSESEGNRDRVTSFRDRDNDRPFKKRSESEGNRDRGTSFRNRDNDRPFKKRSESEGNRDRGTSFRSRDNDRPFKKRSESKGRFSSEENRDRAATPTRDGDRPFKKRSVNKEWNPTGSNRSRGIQARDNDPTLRKRIINKDRSYSDRRAKAE